MDTLIKKHFSLTDWNFEPGNRYYLNAITYKSPPSSLAAPWPPWTRNFYYCYLKDTLAPCVPDGRFIAYFFLIEHQLNLRIFFRQQPPLVSNGDQNGYRIDYLSTFLKWRLYRYINGVSLFLGEKTIPSYPYATWKRLRFDFYQYLPPGLIMTLKVEVFHEVTGEWVSLGFLEDGANQFANSLANRVGFSLEGAFPMDPSCIDDTEIWKKA